MNSPHMHHDLSTTRPSQLLMYRLTVNSAKMSRKLRSCGIAADDDPSTWFRLRPRPPATYRTATGREQYLLDRVELELSQDSMWLYTS